MTFLLQTKRRSIKTSSINNVFLMSKFSFIMQQVEENSIKMKSLNVGQREFRCIRVKASIFHGILPSDQNSILLFFGSDVLANTLVSTKNMAREHCNRSKTHHCSKLSFSSRLAGVRGNATEAWFYDIRGLVDVAFRYYSFEEQLAVLKCFFTIWSNSADIALPSLLSLSPDNVVDGDIIPTVLMVNENLQKSCPICDAEERDRLEKSRRKNKEASTQQSLPIMVPKAVQCIEKEVVRKNVACQIDINTYHNTVDSDKIPECHLKTKVSLIDEKIITEQFLNALSSVVKSYFQASTLNIFFYKVYILMETFVHLLHEERHLIEATTTGIFPFHLILEYANCKNSYEQQHNRQISPEIYCQDIILQIHSKWLATQYHKFRPIINTQIEHYKKTLIEQNKCLPSPVQLATECELYPSCMVEFLNGWLSGTDGGVQKEEERFHFSKILLVLELLNDNPITGVGHVVYAKLKSSDFV